MYQGSIRSPALKKTIARFFGPGRSVSVSDLERYVRCPRSFFFRVILELVFPREPDETLLPVESGDLVHQTLAKFYSGRILEGKTRIDESEIEAAWTRLKEIARGVFRVWGCRGIFAEEQLYRITGSPGKPSAGLLWKCAEYEASVCGDLEPVLVEWPFEYQPADSEQNPSGKTRVRGTIDRIDRAAGTLVVFDYKTGGIPTRREIDDFESIQLGVYAMAVRDKLAGPVMGICYYQVSPGKGCRIRPVMLQKGTDIACAIGGRGAMDSDTFERYFDRLGSIIDDALRNMGKGSFTPVYKASRCKTCEYRYLRDPVWKRTGGNAAV